MALPGLSPSSYAPRQAGTPASGQGPDLLKLALEVKRDKLNRREQELRENALTQAEDAFAAQQAAYDTEAAEYDDLKAIYEQQIIDHNAARAARNAEQALQTEYLALNADKGSYFIQPDGVYAYNHAGQLRKVHDLGSIQHQVLTSNPTAIQNTIAPVTTQVGDTPQFNQAIPTAPTFQFDYTPTYQSNVEKLRALSNIL